MRRGLALLTLFVGGCFFAPAAPPDDARVGCTSDDDCPDTVRCAAFSGRCAFVVDTPALENLRVEPAAVRAGVDVTISFTVDAALAEAPALAAEWGNAGPFVSAPTAAAGEFAFRYTPSGEESEGEQAFRILLTGVDRAFDTFGNLGFDFTPPGARLELLDEVTDFGVTSGGVVNFLLRDVGEDEVIESVVAANDDAAFALTFSEVALGGTRTGVATLPDPLDAALLAAGGFELRVTVVDAVGNAQALSSLRVPIDLVPPTATFSLPASTTSPFVTLSVADPSADAVSMKVDGDLVGQGQFIPVVSSLDLQLNGAPGTRTISVILRDGAGNSAEPVLVSTELLDGLFVVPQLSLPNGQVTARADDAITIGGLASVNATLTAARLVDASSQATDLDGVTLSGGVLAGALDLASAAEGRYDIELDVELDGETVTGSAAFTVDDTPPTLELSYAQGTSGAVALATLNLVAPPDATEVTFATGPDILSVRRQNGSLVAFDAFVPRADTFEVAFSSGDGPKTLDLRVRDGSHLVASGDITFTVDSTLIDSDPVVTAPTLANVAGPGETLALSGTATPGAVLQSARVLLGDVNCEEDLNLTVQVSGGVISGSYQVPAVLAECASSLALEVIVEADGVLSDPALSRSAAIVLDDDPPVAGPLSLTGAGFNPLFTSSPSITINTIVTDVANAVDVRLEISSDLVPSPNVGAFLPMFVSGGVFSRTLAATLTGNDASKVVRVVFRDAFGNLSAPVEAAIVLDTLPPALPDVARVRITELAGDPGGLNPDANNTVEFEGLSAAVDGDTVQVRLDSSASSQTVIAAGGTFSTTTLVAAADGRYEVTAIDDAGNAATASVQMPRGTVVSPTLAALEPITFDYPGGISSAAAFINGGAAIEQSPTQAVYSPTGDEAELPLEALARISLTPLSATAGPGSVAVESRLVQFDFTPPELVDIDPGPVATWNGLPSINGTASDGGSGLVAVTVSVIEANSGLFWDGAAFSDPSEVALDATGLGSWSLSDVAFTAGEYTVNIRATDAVGNLGLQRRTFLFNDGAQGTPTNVQALTGGPNTVSLTWDLPPAALDAVFVDWVDSQGATPPAGIQNNPAELNGNSTSLLLKSLPPETYTFTVTGSRIGLQFPAPPVEAAAREFIDVLSGGLVAPRAVAVEGTTAVVGFADGVVAISQDRGATWVVRAAVISAVEFIDINQGRAIVASVDGEVGLVDIAGLTYEPLTPPGVSQILALGYDGAAGIVVTGLQTARSTEDMGLSWNSLILPVGTTIADIGHGPSSPVLVGAASNDNDGVVFVAQDGAPSLTPVFTAPDVAFNHVAVSGSGALVCGDRVFRSTDLSNFAAASPSLGTPCDDIAVAGDHAVVAAADTVFASDDGGAVFIDAVNGLASPVRRVAVNAAGLACYSNSGDFIACRYLGSSIFVDTQLAGRAVLLVDVFDDGHLVVPTVDNGAGVITHYGP